ncbi:hypothetical protein NIES298_31480 [Microcystis aeruginosa NIES-298]|nr:hypothetical protein NIES298_31480 [Microcystis aeruginosa NIES-298]
MARDCCQVKGFLENHEWGRSFLVIVLRKMDFYFTEITRDHESHCLFKQWMKCDFSRER